MINVESLELQRVYIGSYSGSYTISETKIRTFAKFERSVESVRSMEVGIYWN